MPSKYIAEKDLTDWTKYIELRGRFVQALVEHKAQSEERLKRMKVLVDLASRVRLYQQQKGWVWSTPKKAGWPIDLAKEVRKWADKNL